MVTVIVFTNKQIANHSPDFLTIYGCFVAVTGVLWLGHTIYLHTNIPRNRRLRRVEGTCILTIYPDAMPC
jgi:hypothetical protein